MFKKPPPTRHIDFDRPMVAKHNPATSTAAEADNQPRRRGQMLEILALLNAGPMTADAWELSLHIPHGPRAKQMLDRGWIEDTGYTSPTRWGSEATVYRITEAGRAQL